MGGHSRQGRPEMKIPEARACVHDPKSTQEVRGGEGRGLVGEAQASPFRVAVTFRVAVHKSSWLGEGASFSWKIYRQ